MNGDRVIVLLKINCLWIHHELNLFHVTEFAEIQRWNKESLIFRCRNSLSHDWLPEERARSFSLRGYYVNLNWLKIIKHVMSDERVPMRRIHDIFVNLQRNQPVRILVTGEVFQILKDEVVFAQSLLIRINF